MRKRSNIRTLICQKFIIVEIENTMRSVVWTRLRQRWFASWSRVARNSWIALSTIQYIAYIFPIYFETCAIVSMKPPILFKLFKFTWQDTNRWKVIMTSQVSFEALCIVHQPWFIMGYIKLLAYISFFEINRCEVGGIRHFVLHGALESVCPHFKSIRSFNFYASL